MTNVSRPAARAVRFLTVALLVATLGAVAPSAAYGAAQTENGAINVTLVTPAGIPASVALTAASRYVATKPPTGTSRTVPLSVAPGAYKVGVEPMTIDGQFYVPRSSRPEVPVRAGQTAAVEVTYTLDTSARDFHAASVEPTSITLTWTAEPRFRIVVRRTMTEAPAQAPGQGVHVPISGGSAVDSGLAPGTQYTYALFAQDNAKWVGPMVLRVGTVSPVKTAAAYVASPQTQILQNSDVLAATTTGNGVRVVLRPGLPTPLMGAAVVLPISTTLPGGFLGVVTDVSPDGQTLQLVAGGITDAFDYYSLSVPDFQGGDPAPSSAESAPGRGGARTGERRSSDDAAPVAPASLLTCLGGSIGGQISFAPEFELNGHFHGTITKYEDLGVPIGASLDIRLAATISGRASLTSTAAFTCNADLPPTMVPIAVTPVPLSFHWAPAAQLVLGGSLEVSNLGLTATAGVELAGHFGLTEGADFSGDAFLSATPSTPTVVANGSIGFKVGGQVIVGPGAGTPAAGVIAGVGGELNLLDATFGPVYPASDPNYDLCLKASVASTRALYAIAKAWVGNWEESFQLTLDALKGSTDFPGSPWYFPAGCNGPGSPGDSVLGDGVTKVDDSVTGGAGQVGNVPGLVPGQSTWALSTGDIANVVGSPSDFASTGVGGPGDSDLSAMFGYETFDAAAYRVTLIPTGSTLHIRYVFASEEYPEFVGSTFNDTMAVFVNGQNCATVPGTAMPVSINTINASSSSQYFVDNESGAGYPTSMDGMTVPLECTVAVQVGQPVTVKFVVADASDQWLDSAVAILDRGIWAD